MNRFLLSRIAPIVFGSLTFLENWFVRGSFTRSSIVQDETAYLLQARIFASGRWVAAAPPLPEFFEQFNVLVTPVFASKYPPGHSFVLVPGIWAGLPGLVPTLLAGIAGGFVFLLARRYTNGWIALLTWLIWTTSPGFLRFLTSYLSQNTTVVLSLLAWWALGNWLRTKRVGWLVSVFVIGAWGVLTRPFTALAIGAPVAGIAVREVLRRRNWREATLALIPAALVLAVIPIWSVKTTGEPWTTPYELYSRIYFPYQRPGFGLPRVSTSQRTLPPDMERYAERHRAMHASHTLSTVPRELGRRLRTIGFDSWGEPLFILLGCAAVGLLVQPREGWFAVSTAALLVAVHIPLAHPPTWSIYYVELGPVLSFLAAIGIWTLIGIITGRRRVERRRFLTESPSTATALALAVAVVLAFGPLLSRVIRVRELWSMSGLSVEYFQRVVASIPEPRAIVFVRYGPAHDPNGSLISNEPDLSKAKAWIVHDRGSDNVRLLERGGGRVPYLYDEGTHTLMRWRPPPFGMGSPSARMRS